MVYDAEKLAYTKLLEWFLDNVDPTDPEGQFCDKGSQYAAGIFYTSAEQKEKAEISMAQVEKKLGMNVATFLRLASEFYPAEEYHQQYYKKNRLQYKLYKSGCGRERILKKIWNQS